MPPGPRACPPVPEGGMMLLENLWRSPSLGDPDQDTPHTHNPNKENTGTVQGLQLVISVTEPVVGLVVPQLEESQCLTLNQEVDLCRRKGRVGDGRGCPRAGNKGWRTENVREEAWSVREAC